MEKYDVVSIGGGVAGSIAARLAAVNGLICEIAANDALVLRFEHATL